MTDAMQTPSWALWPWPFFDASHQALAGRCRLGANGARGQQQAEPEQGCYETEAKQNNRKAHGRGKRAAERKKNEAAA